MKAVKSSITLLLLSLLALAAVSADAAAVGTTSTSSDSDEGVKDEAPIDVDVVMEVAAKQVWEKLFPGTPAEKKTPFLIAGSYAAAVKMYEHDRTIIPYNDIDVFVGHPYPEKLDGNDADYCQGAVPGHFKDNVLYVDNVYDAFRLRRLGGEDEDLPPLNIVILCSLDPEQYVENSDINAVSVGFVVEPKPCSSFFKLKACPQMSHWIVSEPFKKFMKDPTETLQIKQPYPQGGSNGFKSIVRLLKKASQLDLPFKFPSDKELIAMDIEGQYINEFAKAMFDSLPEEYQDEIWNRFDIYYTKNGRFILRKKSIDRSTEVSGAIKLRHDLLMGRRRLNKPGSFSSNISSTGFSSGSISSMGFSSGSGVSSMRSPGKYVEDGKGETTVVQTEFVDIQVYRTQEGNEVVQISSLNNNNAGAVKTATALHNEPVKHTASHHQSEPAKHATASHKVHHETASYKDVSPMSPEWAGCIMVADVDDSDKFCDKCDDVPTDHHKCKCKNGKCGCCLGDDDDDSGGD